MTSTEHMQRVCLPEVLELWADAKPRKTAPSGWLSRPVRFREEEKVKELLGETQDSIVLDLGCGSGRYAHSLDYSAYVGIDPQKNVCEFARERAEGLQTNYAFHQQSLFDVWPVVPDVVLSMNVMRHFINPFLGYQHIYERLPKGARWVTSFLTTEKEERDHRSISMLVPEHEMRYFLNGKEHTEPQQWFKEAGNWWLTMIVR